MIICRVNDVFHVDHREVRIQIGKKHFIVDGFDPITRTIFEFNGDSWHGNPAIFNHNDTNPKTKKTYGELYQSTLIREKMLRDAGYTVISIWESDFDKMQIEKKKMCMKFLLTV